MLLAAESLMRERGLAGAAIKAVVARSRAPLGSVYYHFPGGKAQLAAEALRMHGEKALRILDEAFGRPLSVPERVRRFFSDAAQGFEGAGPGRSCAIGNVTLGLGSADDELRGVCESVFASWVTRIAAHLPWGDAEKRRSFAELIVTALEGAFVVSRARRTGEPFARAGEWLATVAERYDPGG